MNGGEQNETQVSSSCIYSSVRHADGCVHVDCLSSRLVLLTTFNVFNVLNSHMRTRHVNGDSLCRVTMLDELQARTLTTSWRYTLTTEATPTRHCRRLHW
eukprot:5762552-Pyramimonas_sp.AAC.2